MMRFLAIAVTLGFIFIGWRIQHIILNPLLNQQKRNKIAEDKTADVVKTDTRVSMKSSDNESLFEQNYIEKHTVLKTIREEQSSFSSSDMDSEETTEEIKQKIKTKKKQLGYMWSILFTILFIGFYEMAYSGIQKIINFGECNHMFNNDAADAFLLLVSRFIGLVLWTIPVIYVYWAREFIISVKARSLSQDDDDDEIDQYFEHETNEAVQQTKVKQVHSPLVLQIKRS